MRQILLKLKHQYWELERQVHLKKLQLAKIPKHFTLKGSNHSADVIVSLTSYPKRYETLYLNIKSLLLQSHLPHQIVLWIAYEDYDSLPLEIKELAKNCALFSVKTCADIRSFKKIIPALAEYPNFHIVTADDDVIYPKDWLKTLLQSWSGDAKEVVAHRAHKLSLDCNGALEPYVNWPAPEHGEKNESVFQTGIGGVLYPVGSLHESVQDQETFMQLCPTADDIWLYWMVRKSGAMVKKSDTKLNVVNLPGTDEHGLATQNVINKKNDEQMQRMYERYGKNIVS